MRILTESESRVFNAKDSINEKVTLGGGMALPFDTNYCIFVNSSKKTNTIKIVSSKDEFKSAERSYGTFVAVQASLSAAKEYVTGFTGAAKDNTLVIL